MASLSSTARIVMFLVSGIGTPATSLRLIFSDEPSDTEGIRGFHLNMQTCARERLRKASLRHFPRLRLFWHDVCRVLQALALFRSQSLGRIDHNRNLLRVGISLQRFQNFKTT